jgi:antitoxin (DNA-binding transcriptional repressor) of toxin-antitoxin stability system
MKKPLRIVNIQEAKAQLSQLVDLAARGESFIIARAGKSLVKVTAIEAPNLAPIRRFGFMQGLIAVPQDFDEIGRSDIESMFNPA